HHLAAAHAAHEKAAEQIRRRSRRYRTPLRLAVRSPRVEVPHLLEPLVGRCPRLFVDDPKVRARIDDRLLRVAANGDTSVGARDLAPLPRSVAPAPDVALVVEHRSDCGVLPADAPAGRVNPPNHLRLLFIDLNLGPNRLPIRARLFV